MHREELPRAIDLEDLPGPALVTLLAKLDPKSKSRMRLVNKTFYHMITKGVVTLRMNIKNLSEVKERSCLALSFPQVKVRVIPHCHCLWAIL